MKEKVLYSFKTTDFYYRPKQPAWYANSAIIFFGVAGIFIFYFHYYFTAIIVLLSMVALFVHSSQESKEIVVEITNKEIKVGRKKYPFSKLVTYWIYTQGTDPKLYFKTNDLLFDLVSVPLGEGDPKTIRQQLANLLPEEDRGEVISDKISRWISY